MISPHLSQQIRDNMEQAKAQAVLSTMFERVNHNQETAAKEREDDKLLRARYWWNEKEVNV